MEDKRKRRNRKEERVERGKESSKNVKEKKRGRGVTNLQKKKFDVSMHL